MNDPLDHPYQLAEQQDQLAFNGLVALEQPLKPFLWTGRPYSLRTDFIHLFKVEGCFSSIWILCYGLFLLAQWQTGTMATFLFWSGLVLVPLFTAIAVVEQRRRQTFYGITAKEVWVKLPKEPLIKYTIAAMTHFNVYPTGLSCSILRGVVEENCTLFYNIDNSSVPYNLLLSLQKNIP